MCRVVQVRRQYFVPGLHFPRSTFELLGSFTYLYRQHGLRCGTHEQLEYESRDTQADYCVRLVQGRYRKSIGQVAIDKTLDSAESRRVDEGGINLASRADRF